PALSRRAQPTSLCEKCRGLETWFHPRRHSERCEWIKTVRMDQFIVSQFAWFDKSRDEQMKHECTTITVPVRVECHSKLSCRPPGPFEVIANDMSLLEATSEGRRSNSRSNHAACAGRRLSHRRALAPRSPALPQLASARRELRFATQSQPPAIHIAAR